ncbi:MAG: radical SAM protein [candidate division Zixibacteria bacterium]
MNAIKMPEYLRLSLLSNCNLNCFYCRPPGTNDPKLPQIPPGKFFDAIRALHQLGIRKIRFTGGEPTLYKPLPKLISHAKEFDPDIFTAITTNGLLLEKLAPLYAESGLDSVNISLDTLNPDKFRSITSVDGFDKVIRGIESTRESISEVKLNCVLINGVNDDEADDMIEFANTMGIDIRFIEYMPTRHNNKQRRGYLANEELRANSRYEFSPLPHKDSAAARYFSSPDLDIRVGFISPVSHPFCASCDRIRLTADGMIYGCLFSSQGFNLFSILNDKSIDLQNKLSQILASKNLRGCNAAMNNLNSLPSFYQVGG